MLTLLAPSRRVLLVFGFVPFTKVRSDRPGVSVWSFWNAAGVAPGTRLMSVW